MRLNIKAYLLLGMFTFWNTTALAIDAPVEPRGTEVGQSKVKWEWQPVAGAYEYELVVDGADVYVTQGTEYFSYNLWAGEHSLTVRAKTLDGEFSVPTPTAKIEVNDWFNATSFNRSFIVGRENYPTKSTQASTVPVIAKGVVASATNVQGTVIDTGTVLWQWSGVAGATRYEVTVDGEYIGTTQNTNFTSDGLWEGDHSMTVVVVGANGEKSEQSETAKLWVAAGNVPATQAAHPVPQAALPVAQLALPIERNAKQSVDEPLPSTQVPSGASIQSMVDPASEKYSEVFNKAGYELVFSDEFESASLNSYRWNTGLRWDGEFNGERYEYRVINGEDQFYVNTYSEDQEHLSEVTPSHNPFEFDGSRLAIRAIKNPLKTKNGDLAYGSMDEMVSQQDFLSGTITTHDKFSQKFGYFEARIKIPSHVGTFPAFWLFHENSVAEGTQKSEIDIMENLGHAPQYVYNTFHYYKNVSATNGGDYNLVKPYPDGQINTGIDYSEDYHVYAVEWEPGKITWLIDGEQVSELESNEVNFEELYLKLNLAIGGQWTSYPTNAGGMGRAYPTQADLDNFKNPALEIDYVRVYKRY